MDKKKIFIWSLYDFANSIVAIAFFLYFSQWLVIDKGISDFWFNIILVASSLLYLAVGPVLGSIADKTGNKTTGIRVTTVVAAVFYFLVGVVTTLYPSHTVIAVIFFVLGASVYLLSFIYYNSFLNDLAPPGKQGFVSGWGLLGNYLGQITAVIITFPFATGLITLWGVPGRAQVFIPAVMVFFVLSLPFLITFKNETVKKVSINLRDEYRGVWKGFVNLCKLPAMGRFLLAYFFFNDAVLTASNNFPIYMERVFAADDGIKSLVMLAVLITSAISSPLSGWIADKIGLRKTLLGILVGWIIIVPLMALVSTIPMLIILAIFMGLLFGSVWTVTRAMVSYYAPHEHLNTSYVYFALMERFATFLGPLSWGIVVAVAPHAHAFNYRAALFAMVIFIIMGLVIAWKLPKITFAQS